MADDKILDVGGVSALGAAKDDLPADASDRLKDSELGIPEDIDIEKVEAVYRYVRINFLNVLRKTVVRMKTRGSSVKQENRSENHTS